MRADRQQVDAEPAGDQRLLPERLHPVAVEQGGRARTPDGRRDRVDGQAVARLVVDGHHAHKYGVRRHRAEHLLRPNPAALRPQRHDLKALRSKARAALGHGRMLHRRRHNPVPAAAQCARRAEYGKVVRLGCARGEHDLLRLRLQGAGDAFARRFQRALGGKAQPVQRGGVSKIFTHCRAGGGRRLRQNPRRRAVV